METKLILLLTAVILASGCADNTTSQSGSGLQITDFSVADTSLNPEQKTSVTAKFVNFNRGPTTLDSANVKLFNTGELEVLSKECTPSEIGRAKEGINPRMECLWSVRAPGEDFIQGFNSKPMSINLQYTYDASLDSDEPLTVEFKDGASINERSTKTLEFSDNAVKVSAETENPLAHDSQGEIQIVAENTGNGDLVGDYEFNYTPSQTFDCPQEKEPIDGEIRLDCHLDPLTKGERNMFISTSYKYKQIKNTYIEVVQ